MVNVRFNYLNALLNVCLPFRCAVFIENKALIFAYSGRGNGRGLHQFPIIYLAHVWHLVMWRLFRCGRGASARIFQGSCFERMRYRAGLMAMPVRYVFLCLY